MMALLTRLRMDVIAAYIVRFAMGAMSLVLRPLPRRHKITLLTRQSDSPPDDFALLAEALKRADASLQIVMIAHMVPPGIVRKFGYAVRLFGEIYHVETSRVLVIDGYSVMASATRPSKDLTVVQMWHALGALKKFGLSIVGQPGGRSPRLAKVMRMHQGYDIAIASAERCREPFAEALGLDISRVIVAPLPRVDRLRDAQVRADARARLYSLYPELRGTKIALFAPTFRTEGLDPRVDPVELTGALDAAGYAMVTKLHPLVPAPTDAGLRTAPGMSTQDLLLVADVFITDYSSTVFEAAVARVPSYLIAPDLHEYAQRRDFYVRYPDDLGLPMAMTVSELVALISDGTCDLTQISTFVASLEDTPYASASDHLAARILGTAHLPDPKETTP